MTGMLGRFVVVAVVAATWLGTSNSAMAQRNRWLADELGLGVEGTIGRGTNILPGGPSERDAWSYTRPRRASGTTTYYRAGYSGYAAPPTSRPAAPVAAPASAPYRTNQFFTPGDGYRYPLYFNPATRAYFYYPARH